MNVPTQDILRTPYRLGGRTVGAELDCLGVVGEIARRRGLPAPDGWPSILRAMAEGSPASGFPAGWFRIAAGSPWQEGDVLVLPGVHPGCAIVHDGRIWTARPGAGVHAVPIARWSQAPSQVWRFAT